MEVCPRRIEIVLGPAVIHIPPEITLDIVSQQPTWDSSIHNPKNRINRLWPKSRNWRLFRDDLVNLRLSAVPVFAVGCAPLRIDVVLADLIGFDRQPWTGLGPDIASWIQSDGSQISPLAEHIVSALDAWSNSMPDFEERYSNLPFGSRIVIENLAEDLSMMRICLDPCWDLELKWLSLEALKQLWGLEECIYPPSIDITSLGLIAELHESISLVSLRGQPRPFIFKANQSNPKYLYHELKQLLSLDPHPNIIRRPSHIITKRVKFGGKQGVCGFLLEYCHIGNLAQAIRTSSALRGRVDLRTRFRWVYQIATALEHIKRSPVRFFSDMKLENVVLRQANGQYDAVLIDFEQRGAWFSWSPPEINKITHLIYLATNNLVPESDRESYCAFLDIHVPDWSAGKGKRRKRYENSDIGYNISWRLLTADERDQAGVFMFGKILWCLFELQPTSNAAEFLGAEVFREEMASHRFPEFRQTPPQIQDLVKQCTRGAPEWSGTKRCITRIGGTIYPAQRTTKLEGAEPTAAEALETLRNWWSQQLKEAKDYLSRRFYGIDTCREVLEARNRPKIEQVVMILHKFGQAEGLCL